MKLKPFIQPLFFALLIVVGIVIGVRISKPYQHSLIMTNEVVHFNKLAEMMNYIEQAYVDTVNEQAIVTETIEEVLSHLDPHSTYIPAEQLAATNEPLQGNFEGIGIEFHITNDSLMVAMVLEGGPSEKMGIAIGKKNRWGGHCQHGCR